VRTLSSDRQLLTYAHRWVDKNGGNEVRSTQILQRVGELPPDGTAAAAGEAGSDEADASAALPTLTASFSALKTLDSFVTGYETPPDGYATPPEDFPDPLSHDDLVHQLQSAKDGCASFNPEGAAGGLDANAGGDEEAKDVDPSAVKLKWMWADAGVSGVTSKLAQANPFRWSKALLPEDLKAELLKQSKPRPVLISLLAHKHRMTFADPAAGAAWIDESLRSDLSELQKKVADSSAAAAPQGTDNGKSKREGVLTVGRFVAPAYCVYFMRRHATTSWKHKNVFVASAYARRASQLPHQISAMQESANTGAHPRREAAYEDLATTGALTYKELVEAASPFAFPQRPQQLEAGGKLWLCVDSSPYWMGWVAQTDESECTCVVTLRGADGSTLDACHHPGSPVRAFIQGVGESDLPPLPLELIRSLAERVAEVRSAGGTGSITLAGYSQGGLIALACALWLGGGGGQECCTDLDPDCLTAVHLFNWFVAV